MTWGISDYLNLLLGLVDGAMGSLPSTSNTFHCNKNSTAARLTLITMLNDFSMKATTKGMANLNILMSYAHPVAYNCYTGLSQTIKPSTYSTLFTFSSILENTLYNAGYIY